MSKSIIHFEHSVSKTLVQVTDIYFYIKYFLVLFYLFDSDNGGDGWFIGGRSENGVWRWADNSAMDFQNFPPVRASINIDRPTSTVINYAVIFKGDYQWGYVAPRPTPRMGYVCENMTC